MYLAEPLTMLYTKSKSDFVNPTGVERSADQVAVELEEYLERKERDGWELMQVITSTNMNAPLALFRSRKAD